MKLGKQQVKALLTRKWGEYSKKNPHTTVDNQDITDAMGFRLNQLGLICFEYDDEVPCLTEAGKIVVGLLRSERKLELKVERMKDDLDSLLFR